MQGCSNHGNVSPDVVKTVLQSRLDVEAAANTQGRLAKKNIFIHIHRLLLPIGISASRGVTLRFNVKLPYNVPYCTLCRKWSNSVLCKYLVKSFFACKSEAA